MFLFYQKSTSVYKTEIKLKNYVSFWDDEWKHEIEMLHNFIKYIRSLRIT